MKYHNCLILIFTLFLSAAADLFGQPWNFVKEADGIKIFTRNEKNSSLKSFKGEMIFRAPMGKVCSMLGNARNFDWWGPDFVNIRVLAYEKNRFVQYYYIYNMPWPLTDRDFVVNATVKTDSATGKYSVLTVPLLKVIPEKPGLVRIKNYWQKWTIQPMDKGNVHVILEGFVDPGGDVPSWLYNMLVNEMPLKTMRLLRERVLSDKPAN